MEKGKRGYRYDEAFKREAIALISRERRMELGMSQKDLANGTLTQSHISFLESGKREIGMSRFILLARKLQMEPWELLRAVVERMR